MQCADRRPTEDLNEGSGIDSEKLKMLSYLELVKIRHIIHLRKGEHDFLFWPRLTIGKVVPFTKREN